MHYNLPKKPHFRKKKLYKIQQCQNWQYVNQHFFIYMISPWSICTKHSRKSHQSLPVRIFFFFFFFLFGYLLLHAVCCNSIFISWVMVLFFSLSDQRKAHISVISWRTSFYILWTIWLSQNNGGQLANGDRCYTEDMSGRARQTEGDEERDRKRIEYWTITSLYFLLDRAIKIDGLKLL